MTLEHLGHVDPWGEALTSAAITGTLWVAVTAYVVGEWLLRRPSVADASPMRWRRVGEPALFIGGSVTLGAVVLPPLGERLEETLAGHMVQHMALILLVAPALVMSRPGPRLMRAIGIPLARRAVRCSQSRTGRVAGALANDAAFVWILFGVVLWSWHDPPLYDAAVHDGLLHGLEHVTMLVSAMLCVRTLVGRGRRRRLSPAGGIVAIAATGMHSAVLGALLVLTTRPLYPIYRTGRGATAALHDQQLAGVLMWVAGAPVFLAGVAVVLVRALRDAERDAQRDAQRDARRDAQRAARDAARSMPVMASPASTAAGAGIPGRQEIGEVGR